MRPIKIYLKMLIVCILFVLLFSPFTTAASQQSITKRVAGELQAKMPGLLEKSGAPGAAVAVVDDKEILWQYVYGHTSHKKERPVTPETIFSIQSMSKSFTALGVLMAVQEGILDLDTPITKYIPDFTVNSPYEKEPGQKMTLRHLLAHRAGFTHEAPVGGNFDSRPHTFEEHILSISSTWLRYPVGYRFSYSNLGIDLAGYILEKKSDMPSWKYIREKILVPLGMTRSTMNVDEILKRRNKALGHCTDIEKVQGGIPVKIPMIPAGGVYSNIPDMARYLQFHINNGRVNNQQLMRKNLMNEMHSAAFREKNQRAGYGLCLNRNLVGSTYYLSHSGSGYGFRSYMAMYPELKLGIVVLLNSQNIKFDTRDVLSMVHNIIEQEQGKAKPWPGEPDVETSNPLNATDQGVKKIMGYYENNIRIGLKEKVLGIFFGKDFYPLKMYLDKGEMVGVFGKNSKMWFKPPLPSRNGSMVHLDRLSGTCRYYDFHKPDPSLDRKGMDKPDWRKHCGKYGLLHWGKFPIMTMNITIEDGYLTLDGSRCREYVPGLFFSFDGEALDFRGTIATYANIMLIRQK